MDGVGMTLCTVAIADGTYTLCVELSPAQAALLVDRLEQMAEIYAAELADDLDDDDDADHWFPFEDGTIDVSHEAPCWWFQEADCVNAPHCHCGPVTLLEVLTRSGPESRPEALAAHLQLMEKTWSHYWSGQGLLEGGTASIGDACSDCLISGAQHVYDVHGTAASLAEELGEAISAFACSVLLGEPKWTPGQTVED